MKKPIASDIDLEIAKYYTPYVLGSLKYGENRVCVWFPGSGRTRVISDILYSKQILKDNLRGLYKRVEIVSYLGTSSDSGSSKEILQNIAQSLGLEDSENPHKAIEEKCLEIINLGKEIVLIGNQLDYLQNNELKKLLTALSNIISVNQNRIHSILNIHNFENLINILNTLPTTYRLANKFEFLPLINGPLLTRYITQRAGEFSLKIDKKEVSRIENYSGGILFLTKEILRNYNNHQILNLKIRSVWSEMSNGHKSVISKLSSSQKILASGDVENLSNLKMVGVSNLSIFNDKITILENDTPKLLKSKLSLKEFEIYKLFVKHTGVLVSKETVAKIIWGKESYEKYSDWAIDKTTSRLRVGLAASGIDPEILKTVKGRGYIWQKNIQ